MGELDQNGERIWELLMQRFDQLGRDVKDIRTTQSEQSLNLADIQATLRGRPCVVHAEKIHESEVRHGATERRIDRIEQNQASNTELSKTKWATFVAVITIILNAVIMFITKLIDKGAP